MADRVLSRRPALRWTVAAVAGMAAVAALGSVTAAEPQPVQQEAWSWLAAQGPLAPPAAASGIGENQLPVSNTAAGPEKVSRVTLELADPDALLVSLTVRLPVDPQGRNVALDQAKIVACLVTEPWQPVAAGAWDTKPRTDCSLAAPAVYSAAASEYVVDLTALASVWEPAYNYGFSLEPAPGAPAFQVVFKGSKAGGVLAESEVEPQAAPEPFTDEETAVVDDEGFEAVPFDPATPSLASVPLGGPSPLLAAPGQQAPARRRPARSAEPAEPDDQRPFTLRWPYGVIMLLSIAGPVLRAGVEVAGGRRGDEHLFTS